MLVCCQSELRQTDVAQPAILLHSVAAWRVLSREVGCTSAADICSTVMGHSLGEFSALCVAGVMPFADAVRLVVSSFIQHADKRRCHECETCSSNCCVGSCIVLFVCACSGDVVR